MPTAELNSLAEKGDIDSFETRCLELLESGQLQLSELTLPFERLQKKGKGPRVVAIAQMVLEAAGEDADPAAALKVGRLALDADPTNAVLRKRVVALFGRVYSHLDGFQTILDASGLGGDRPLRNALRVLDVCLPLKKGDTLLSRTDDHAVEVADVDLAAGLFTLRKAGRSTTMPALELAREYEPVASDDFRVLQQLWPDRLPKLVASDPMALVLGLIHAHGGVIDADTLKHELVPRYLPVKDWTKWWTSTRSLLKRSPHVIMEGRSPVVLRHSAAGQSLEDETWATFVAQREPAQWLETIESYVREKAKWKELPDPAFLHRCHDHIAADIAAARAKRPAEALAGALVIQKLAESGLHTTEATRHAAEEILRLAPDPARLIRALPHNVLWERAFLLLPDARPADAAQLLVGLMPMAPAGMLDRIVTAAAGAGLLEAVQAHIDAGVRDPLNNPEIIYWLWKGPDKPERLKLPPTRELFTRIMDVVGALGRTLSAPAGVIKEFRARMKSALALKDYTQVRACLQQISPDQAVTIRGQIERMDGMGENARSALIDALRDTHSALWAKPVVRVAPWEQTDIVWSTAAGIQRKTAERDELVNVQMRDNARRIGEAASHGDLSENSEYKFALEERDLLRARLAQMNNELSIAQTLDFHQVPTDHVGVGSRVTLRRMADGHERALTFLGPFETNVDAGIFNYRAPLSQKLMGLHPGDHVTLGLDGRDAEYEIASIANGLADGGPA